MTQTKMNKGGTTTTCSHAWIFYYDSNYKQCHDCKKVLPINKSQNITAYKRKSAI